MKIEALQDIGLNKNEVSVYKILLENRELIASELAEKANLSRTNAYMVLKGMAEKGIIEELERKKKLTYRLEPPQKLLEYAEKRKREMDESHRLLEALIPDLSSSYGLLHNKPGIAYFSGFEGVRKIYEDTLRSNPQEILAFLQPEEVDKRLYLYLTNNYVKERVKRKIEAKVIVALDDAVDDYILKSNEELRKIKTISKKDYPFSVEVNIYDNNVAFIDFHQKSNKLFGVIVTNKAIADSMRSLFYALWERI